MTVQEFIDMSTFNDIPKYHLIHFKTGEPNNCGVIKPIEVKSGELYADRFYKDGVLEPNSKIIAFSFIDNIILITVEPIKQ